MAGLPEGFTLDDDAGAGGPPPGFKLDEAAPATPPKASVVRDPAAGFREPDVETPGASPLSHTVSEAAKGLARGAGNFAGLIGGALAGPFGPAGQLSKLHNLPEPTAEDLTRYGSRANYVRAQIDPDYGERINAGLGVEANPRNKADKYAGTVGEFVGNPGTYLGPGGFIAKMLMGAASGAGSEAAGQVTEGTRLEPVARFAGALAGGPLAAKVIKPTLGAAQQTLADSGVTQMTPGQMFPGPAGWFKNTEDAAMSIPILGSFIRSGRQRSVESFNRATADQALEPIGERLARGTPAGHPTIAEVEQKLSDAYDRLRPQINYIPDRQFAVDMHNVNRDVARLPDSLQRQFEHTINDILGPPAPMHGAMLKSVESELSHIASTYTGSAVASEREMGRAFNDVLRAVRSNLERNNPAHAAELGRINAGWAMYARMRDAAARRPTSEGVFLPSDLLAAAKKGDRSVGHGAFARGDALMQAYGEAGQRVLPSKLPNSGTADRAAQMGAGALIGGGSVAFHPGIAVAGTAALGPYTRLGMNLLHRWAAPTTGPRASYANAARGYTPIARAAAQTHPFEERRHRSPYAP